VATFKLTDATWLDREYEKVKGVLFQALGGANREGVDALELRDKLAYVGLTYYTNNDLLTFKNWMIADGLAEEVGTLASFTREHITRPVKASPIYPTIKRIGLALFWIAQLGIDVYIVLNFAGVL